MVAAIPRRRRLKEEAAARADARAARVARVDVSTRPKKVRSSLR
jgi:hypothetical protein